MHCALSPDGVRVCVAGSDGVIRMFDAATGTQLFTQRHAVTPILHVEFSNYGANVVSSCADGTFKVWDTISGDLRAIVEAHRKSCNSASYDPSNYLIVTAGDEGVLRVFQRAKDGSKAKVARLKPISSGGDDIDALQVANTPVNPQAWSPVRQFKGPPYALNAAVFSHSGAHVISAGSDGIVRVWDVKSQSQIHALDPRAGGGISSLSTAQDGSILVCGSVSGTGGGAVVVWDARSYVRIGSFETKSGVRCVCIGGDTPCGVGAGDSSGAVYWMRYGCVEPNAPEEDKGPPRELKPTSLCTIL